MSSCSFNVSNVEDFVQLPHVVIPVMCPDYHYEVYVSQDIVNCPCPVNLSQSLSDSFGTLWSRCYTNCDYSKIVVSQLGCVEPGTVSFDDSRLFEATYPIVNRGFGYPEFASQTIQRNPIVSLETIQ